MAADVYAPGDTPKFQTACFLPDGVTPVNPTGPVTVTVTNLQTKQVVAGNPNIVTAGNLVIVTIPSSMATTGHYRAACQIQVDGVPTVKTSYYEYVIEKAA